MAVLNLTIADVEEHCKMLRKWLPAYYLGPFTISEHREDELIARFYNTFSEQEPKTKEII